jgi:diguanylate cyclase (GGDEF)-like protein/PAS domain S-box-containing protein
MNWEYSLFAGLLHLAALVSILVAILALRHRHTFGALSLGLLFLAISEWALAVGLETSAVGLESKVFFSKIEYIGSLASPVLFLIFSLEYTQQRTWLNRPVTFLFFAFPLLILLAALTNEQHGLIWTGFSFLPEGSNILVYEHGPAFFAMLIYDYAMLLAAVGVLLQSWKRSRRPFRLQTGILLASLLFPFLGGLIYGLNIGPFAGYEITPVLFLISGILIAIAILKLRLFNLVPIARETLVENLSDGILVLDPDERIVDMNKAARRLIGVTELEALGRPAEVVLKAHPELIRRLRLNQAVRSEVRLETLPPRILELNISLLRGWNRKVGGRLVTLRDVTERRQTEQALSQKNEETSIVNQISLAISGGLEMNQVIKTLHEQCAHVAAIDVFYVALYDESRALINVPFYFENAAYHPGIMRDIQDHPGTIGNVIQTRKTIYLRDNVNPVTRPAGSERKPGTRVKSYVGIPLIARNRVVGVMSIQSYTPNAYSEDQLRLLERIAVYAAIALENARLYAEVQRMAIVDELTGIYNYRGLQELGNREFERARRFERPLSLIFFDIDDFREFNNRYSHSTGNIVLKKVAAISKTVLRSVDILTRYGGDEFVAILPETDLDSADLVARRLTEVISQNTVATPHGDLGVTISLGVATVTDRLTDFNDLIEAANLGEQKAKKAKQDRAEG